MTVPTPPAPSNAGPSPWLSSTAAPGAPIARAGAGHAPGLPGPGHGTLAHPGGLAWHARRRGVRTYLEAGMRFPLGACIVMRNSPGAEVYGIVAGEREQRDGQFSPVPGTQPAQAVGDHWGYMRFVGGDLATAVERIDRSLGGRFAVDLALVRSSPLLPCAAQQAVEIVPHLTPGGAIVVSAAGRGELPAGLGGLDADAPALDQSALCRCANRHRPGGLAGWLTPPTAEAKTREHKYTTQEA